MQGTGGRDTFYNFIAIVMLGFTALAVIVIVLIFLNPNAAFNPFPPGEVVGGGELPTPFQIPTSTPTPALPTLPPSWTPSPTSTIGPSITPSPSQTPTSTPTVTSTKVFTPTGTITETPIGPAPTLTPTQSLFAYVLQPGSPSFTSYFAGPNSNTLCDWAGLAGQVFDTNGFGKVGVRVHVFGSGIDVTVNSGSNASDYGPGGWEVNVHPQAVVRTFTVRIENSLSEPMSDDIVVTTRDNCSENLALVNFTEVP
jgi:hypothetical protein